jgi:two-component system CheB/CheR fusion protein
MEEVSRDQPAELFIVGLGASAGGLQALQDVLSGLPADLDAALVVIQHLSPDFETRMDELLASYTKLPVKRAENDMELEPGVIYLMPPKVEMIVAGGRLLLSERSPDHGLWLPIDCFFRSLGEEAGPRSLGVILSGTGSDGSRGLRAIHEAGGAVIAQDPTTSRFDGMPRSAIDTGVVDVILPSLKIGEAIVRFVEHAKGGERPFSAEIEREGLEGVFELLERDTGVDFSVYKSSTIGRRLERRLVMTGATDVQTYLSLIRHDPAERETLYRDLLIGVTSFFRDPEAFGIIGQEYLPELVRALPDGEPLRIWAAGCATGEEAYSLAIAACEAFRRMNKRPRVRLFATDVHRGSLEIAGAGVYEEASLGHLDRELRERYFVTTPEGRYRVVEELRSSVVFAYHNVLRDAPFTRLDLVTCRNLLIYFTAEAQRKVLALFHFALKRNGVLFLGPSETPAGLEEELGALDRRWKIYRKRRETRLPPDLRGLGGHRVMPKAAVVKADDFVDRSKSALLDRYAPPSFVISAEHQLLHSSGRASRFLTHRDGTPSLLVLDMVRGEIKYALAGALKRARESSVGTVVRYDGIPAETEQGTVRVDVTVARLGGETEPFLVTLEPQPERATPPEQPDFPVGALNLERIEALETELRQAKENLQATIEEMEASNEELQATNEELIASNEELHSANEELQSVNEELHSVNAEHQQKIIELQQLTDDMEHLLLATDVHTVFLDANLHIRKFTPKMAETFNLVERDEGRSIETFTHRLKHKKLLDDVKRVLVEGERVEREVEDLDGRSYLMRVLPYRPRAAIEGVVLTLIDVSGMRRAERRLEERENELAAILENSPAPIYARSSDGRIVMAGRSARHVLDTETPELSDAEKQVLASQEIVEGELELVVDGQKRTFGCVNFPLKKRSGAALVAGVLQDITDRKVGELKQREAIQQRDRFLAMLSHEIRNPLAAIANAAYVMGDASNPETQRAAAVLTRQTGHIKDLLDDLLDVNRMTLERLSIKKEPVDLGEVIERSFEAVEIKARERGITLVRPNAAPALHADRARLQQMITNLLVNAVKFSERSGQVSVDVEGDTERVKVRVRDQGVGIEPAEQSKIFDLFYQLKQDLGRSGGGLGVGLSLARTIAEAHDGTITAESGGRGHGATFEIVLPIGDLTTRAERIAVPDPTAQRALDIVIVEDQDDNRDMLTMLLGALGHRPVGVANAEAGVEAILRLRPAVSLVDIGLPVIDGYEVARRVRSARDGGSLRLIALTGYGRPEDRDKALAAGFDAHMVKPVSREELVRLFATVPASQGGPEN